MPDHNAGALKWLRASSAETIVATLVAADPKKAAEVGLALYLHGSGTIADRADEVVQRIKDRPKETAGRAAFAALSSILSKQ